MLKNNVSIIAYYDALSKDYDKLYAHEQLNKYMLLLKTAHASIERANLLVDLGCGTGLLLEYLQSISNHANTIYYICVDFSLGMIKHAIEKHRSKKLYYVEYIIADISNAPLRRVHNTVFVLVSVLRQGEENSILRLKETYDSSSLIAGLLISDKNSVCPRLKNCELIGKIGYECLYTC